MKIVVIGAGSRSFGRGQMADIFQAKDLNRRDTVLCLVDSDSEALERMMKVAQRIRKHVKSDIRLEGSTDYRETLPGAKYVIIAVARKRYELWEQDFRIPLSYGFRHCYGENGGPGALFHALRSFKLVIPICCEVEKTCPDAFVLNFTNPEARVLHAISHLTRVKAAGFCHGFYGAHHAIARYLNQPLEQLEITSAGMNHFYCVLSVKDKSTGRERLPDALRLAANDPSADPLFRKIVQLFGVFTYPSDDHIGEYLAYGSEFHGTKWHYGRECRKVPTGTAIEADPVVNSITGAEKMLDEMLDLQKDYLPRFS